MHMIPITYTWSYVYLTPSGSYQRVPVDQVRWIMYPWSHAARRVLPAPAPRLEPGLRVWVNPG